MALPSMLKSLPDMERGITRIFHRTANPAEFVQVLQALVNIAPQLGMQVSKMIAYQKCACFMKTCLPRMCATALLCAVLNTPYARFCLPTFMWTSQCSTRCLTQVIGLRGRRPRACRAIIGWGTTGLHIEHTQLHREPPLPLPPPFLAYPPYPFLPYLSAQAVFHVS